MCIYQTKHYRHLIINVCTLLEVEAEKVDTDIEKDPDPRLVEVNGTLSSVFTMCLAEVQREH